MNNKKLLAALLLLGSTGSMLAQVHNKGVLYVKDKGTLYTNGKYTFGAGATALKTKTTRGSNNGIVSLSDAAYTASTNDGTNFVDGFVKIIPTTAAGTYTSPVGFEANYGPIGFETTDASPIVNAYFRADPNTVVGATLDVSVAAVSEAEFWKVTSVNSGKVVLYWNAFSDATTILGSQPLEFLTIVGYDNTNSKWVALNSTITTGSTLASGDMSADVSLGDFTHFTIGSRADLNCYGEAVVYSGDVNAKTWDGTSWSPSAPTINDKAIITGPLTIASGSPLVCYAVEQSADITMGDGAKLTVANGFSGDGKIVMTNLASVIQQNPLATAPEIEMTRISKDMRRYDYVFLSNPTDNPADFFTQLASNKNVAVDGNFATDEVPTPTTPNSAFYTFRTFSATGLSTEVANAANTPKGRGFSADVRNQSPYSSSINIVQGEDLPWENEKEDIHVKITGTTNNGRFDLTVPPSGGYTRLGNPYPSPINLLSFWQLTGDAFEKTAYYWNYNTARGTLLGSSYNNADFASFNLSGGTASSTGGSIPDGFILPMQSVLVQTDAGGTVTVDNCVRRETTLAPPTTMSNGTNGKFRINLQGSDDSFSQILVSYDGSNGTLEFDNGYDSRRLTGLKSEISTLIDDTRYVIQTLPGFNIEDVLPLKLDKRTDETFTFSLATTEGVFNTTSVLLHDKTLGIYHDLSANDYAFTQTDATDTLRFEVVYQNTVLDNGDFTAKNAFAFITKNQFRAQSNSSIAEIAIYDIAGRLIITYTGINQQGFSSDFDKAQGVYIAKIKLVDGTIVNQKVINQ